MKKRRIFYLCSFKLRRVLPAVLKKRFSIPNGVEKKFACKRKLVEIERGRAAVNFV